LGVDAIAASLDRQSLFVSLDKELVEIGLDSEFTSATVRRRINIPEDLGRLVAVSATRFVGLDDTGRLHVFKTGAEIERMDVELVWDDPWTPEQEMPSAQSCVLDDLYSAEGSTWAVGCGGIAFEVLAASEAPRAIFANMNIESRSAAIGVSCGNLVTVS